MTENIDQEREEVEREARRMYDDCPTVKPKWEQLRDVTRTLWRERAAEKLANKG